MAEVQFDNDLACDQESNSGVQYGIAEVAEITGISAYTIRYYDKCGFFPDLARDSRNVRSFTEADITQLRFVDALRKSGLSIEGIQYYVRLQKRGDETKAERLEIVRSQETVLEYQQAELFESLKCLREAGRELEHNQNSQ